jgi:mannan endo-1,4-beta-mannosidase
MAVPPLLFFSSDSRLISWGYYNASDPSKKSLKKAQGFAKDFINRTTGWANKIHKPILLEEFGMARDAWRNPSDPAYKYNPGTPTSHKDTYYQGIFQQIEHLVHQGRHAGANFWAYGGLGRSTDEPNQFNMTWLGGKSSAALDRSLIPLF